MLLDAPHGSLKGFYLNENNSYECRLKEDSINNLINDVQNGIIDFIEKYKDAVKVSSLFEKISGRDAYAPMLLPENEENDSFFKDIVNLMDEMNVG